MLAYSTLHLPFSHAMEHKPACTTQIFRASPDATSSMVWTPFWNIQSRYLLIFLRKSNPPLTIRGNSQWWTTFRGTGANIVLYFFAIPDHHWQLGKILSRGTFVGGIYKWYVAVPDCMSVPQGLQRTLVDDSSLKGAFLACCLPCLVMPRGLPGPCHTHWEWF